MHPHAIFFSGISESLTGYKIEFNSMGPSAYRMKSYNPSGVVGEKTNITRTNIDLPKISLPSVPEVIRVMCVDDSQSIHTLLKKILAKDQGFEIVAHAMNGVEAMEKLKTIKVDAITLDIHMPEMDGVTYLQKNFNSAHPPVVMISSASREDSDTAMKALKYGASDFVEKPSLQNLEEKGDEIRTKLKTVVSDRAMGFRPSSIDIENSKKITIKDFSNKLRVFTASISDLKKIKELYKMGEGNQPATIVFFEGQDEVLPAIVKEHGLDFKNKLVYWDKMQDLKSNEIYFVDLKKWSHEIAKKHESMKCSIMCFGMVSKNCADKVLQFKNAQLLLEDMGSKNNEKSPLKDVASDIVPATSFIYMANVFLSDGK
jgi:chemotaxis protein methyltransferase CheR